MKIKLEKQHFQWGLTAFLVILCSVIAFFLIFRLDVVGSFFKLLGGVLAPFIYGLIMAYLMCPIYNFCVSRSYSLFNRGKYKFKHDLTISKVVGTIISVAVIIVVITGVLWMIIPGLVDSIVKVVDVLPAGLEQFTAWVDVKFADVPIAKESIDDWSKNITNYLIDFVKDTIIPHSGSLAASISGTLLGAIGAMVDFIIGIIICVYFLNIKDTLSAQAKKAIVANFSESRAEAILEGADYTNRTFGGFISGKIIDSAIIGIICFIIMSAFGWEYSLLISCIIGITNIIPFFGPFIGAIPSAILLLMVNPMHCIYFIITVVLLQQFDGNILGPKILGDSTGLSSFWVLFAVLVGGGLFGFKGMVLGIPVFAVLYAYISRGLNRKLQKKGFSTNTLDYKVDKYRIRRPKKKKKPNLDDPDDEINLRSYMAAMEDDEPTNAYVTDQVSETTDEELKEAEDAGHVILEATLVEYDDTEEVDEDESDKN